MEFYLEYLFLTRKQVLEPLPINFLRYKLSLTQTTDFSPSTFGTYLVVLPSQERLASILSTIKSITYLSWPVSYKRHLRQLFFNLIFRGRLRACHSHV
jgi:hypothetical protein